ncbi:arginine N-succinyltransferase [Endozoicomonas sp. Mp262]|uniref:arginine N-succinyltransferase n=1 Tax=Endozoicomonas sp. Mp262 TaxID=2919499 RepID=UPI0021DADDC9
MMIIRPITAKDRDALWHIANKTGPGFTSLQPNPDAVKQKLKWALESLVDTPPDEALYLFVLEDTRTGQVVGICGIESAVGLSAPWYNFKVSTHVHASRELDVYSRLDTLNLCNDHTGYSELCTLFLDQEYRHSRNGQLLSKSRLLFLAAHPDRFSENIIAEMRGYSDNNGQSPFWEGLGRHFFAMDYERADRHVSQGKAFIAELMPRHPIYVNLLPEQAQAVIGNTHDNTTAARRILESEGFRYTGYVDIFDAGPLLESSIEDIRAVRDSRLYKVKIKKNIATDSTNWLMASDQLKEFRCTMGQLAFEGLEYACISPEQAKIMLLEEGDYMRVVPLYNRLLQHHTIKPTNAAPYLNQDRK